ncbi:L-arabinose transport system permease protein AraQ [compost metagenome]
MNPLIISIGRTVIGTLLTLLGCSLLAYGLTKKSTPLRKPMYILVVMTMYLNAGIIPGYLLMYNLNLLNTFWVYVIPGMINAFFLILMKTYFEQLPLELEEAAMVEGAGYFKIFWRIVLPLSKPILATIAIFAAVGQWNNWMDNLLYNTRQELMTLQLMLLRFLQSQSFSMRDAALLSAMGQGPQVTPTSLRMTITIIVIVPVFIIYPFMQRYFVKGIMIGAVKG